MAGVVTSALAFGSRAAAARHANSTRIPRSDACLPGYREGMLKGTKKTRVDSTALNAVDCEGARASHAERDATPRCRRSLATEQTTTPEGASASGGDRPRMLQTQAEFMGPEGIHPLIAELEEKYSTPTEDFIYNAMMDPDGLRERFEREDAVLGAFDFVRWLAYAQMEQRWKKDIPPAEDEWEEYYGRPERAAFSLPCLLPCRDHRGSSSKSTLTGCSATHGLR